MTFPLLLVHLGVGAGWLGGMLYSLFVVQPRVPRVLPDPVRAEELYRELGAGNRWRVVALIGLLAASGAGLLLVPSVRSGHSTAWWGAIGAKVVVLAGAAVLFWWVSWRGWPRRVFALPAELPAHQARFRRVALAMAALVAVGFGLGVMDTHLL